MVRSKCVVPEPAGPPKKRRSASAGTERGPNNQASQSKATKTRAKTQDVERHSLAVTHGQDAVGFVDQAGKRFTARDVDGRKLGAFRTLKAAADAVSAAYGGAP